jgi:biopolymer transport protein ExbD
MRKYRLKRIDDMEINIASLVDIIFLLLLFFIVASTLDTGTIRATLRLPSSGELSNIEKIESITLFLDREGAIYSEKEHLSWDYLSSYLRKNIVGTDGGIDVYADKEVDFDYVAKIIVAGSELGIEKINFLLQREYSD